LGFILDRLVYVIACTGYIIMVRLLLITVACLCSSGCARNPEPKNILLVTVDTLRARNLPCYGYSISTAPAVDALAEKGVLYETCIAHASSTGPALASVLTGVYPSETGVQHNAWPLHQKMATLAGALKEQGYRTAAFVSNFNLRPCMGYNLGFDTYDAKLESQELNRPNKAERCADKTTDAAMAWLTKNRTSGKGPFFVWLHYQDPHGPYSPPEEYVPPPKNYEHYEKTLILREDNMGLNGVPAYQAIDNHRKEKFYRARYDGEIIFFDRHFARLMKCMDELKLNDSTALIFTADHGESMGEHDFWFCHEQDLHNELIHVPLIIVAPGLSPGRCKNKVCHIDIYPTVMALAGQEDLSAYRGKNLLDFPSLEEIRPIYSETNDMETRTSYRSLIMGSWKLIWSPKRNLDLLLYDLDADPGEVSNLYDMQPEQAEKMMMVLIAQDKMARSGKKTDPVQLSPSEKERLKALGYTGK
jgi:arylsulfatase A-like enzyme